ncbi:MAG TPA: CHRD domain-containing protein [Gemmatimonadaceae bacterium]|nr:CHRD domain-containing protein [Gemmatimonadaceae bacterium]
MKSRFTHAALLVALIACGNDGPIPTGVATVRLALVAGADHGGLPFATPMTTEITTTPVYTGDPDGTGDALVTINLGQREVCWELTASNISLPGTAAHIHRAPVGVRGGIVVGLTPPNASGIVAGCASNQNPDLLKEIILDPAAFYVNVHTTDFPAGAVRGQLGR